MFQNSQLHLLIGLLCYLINTSYTQDILGCGGFVKSDVEINFSVVEIKLYTAQGGLKYSTDCAPHNGYYMVPVYDKGDYVLKVDPPPGWTFEPQSVELSIDGTNDKCSKGEDINFQFTGFGVVGKVVSKGQSLGPAGVTLSLTKANSKDVLKQTTSLDGGAFTFEKVLPGEYTVTASHPTWAFEQASTKVTVGRETGNAGSEITVRGYDVTGQVYSEGDAVKGVNFILFSSTVNKKDVTGCEKSDVKGFPTSPDASPICHVVSKDDGSFAFPALPYGDYKVVPFYKGDHITFDVIPSELSFSVRHDSVKLTEEFQVAGFSVQGKVINVEGGKGIGKAKVIVNGKQAAITNDDGTYHLDSMKAGTYTIEVSVPQMTFDKATVKVTPNTPQLPDMIASKYSMCGKIIIDKVPEGLVQVARKRQVTMTTKGKSSEVVSLTTDTDGTFCTDVKPGTYILEVILSVDERKAGLKLAPAMKEVTVVGAPVTEITFSQFRAKVAGKIECLETCGMMQLSLSALSRTEERIMTQASSTSKSASFTFDDVMPGKYRVSLHQEDWCWKEKALEIEVVDKDINDITFSQSGYILSCSLSHDITLNFEHESKPGNVGSFDLSKGVNKFCLAEPGVYKLNPQSCHQFEQDTYRYDTSTPTVLTLTAVRHLVEASVVTTERQTDVTVTIKSSSETEKPTVLGPLKSDKEPLPPKDAKSKPVEQEGPFTYSVTYWARSNEKLSISASSAVLLFYPPSIDLTVQGDACPGEVAKFEGRQGVFIEGQISPALAEVKITITADDDDSSVVASVETDAKGKYRVGPLHGDIKYEVSAEKEGYVMTPVDGKVGHFKAFKLGEISVFVTDEAGSALQGVLLSLSGGQGYRSNKLTDDAGVMVFPSLSPGQYFLRPMMKEYKFEPATQMVDVLEGSAIKLDVKGTRVAFSAYGSVTSLNGEAESGIIVEAVSQTEGTCSHLEEEGKTDVDGTFRIRGLQPGCEYNIQLKLGDANHHIERSAPKVRKVKVDGSDLSNIHIIAFRRMNQMDLSGNVISDPKHLPTLKVTLLNELANDELRELQTVNLGTTSFFYLPAITTDNKNYIVRLESSLSKSAFEYNTIEYYFQANTSFKHFTFKFEPKAKQLEQELSQSSFMVIPLAGLIIMVIYNHQKLIPFMTQGSSALQSALQNRPQGPNPHPAAARLEEINPELAGGDAAGSKKRRIRKA